MRDKSGIQIEKRILSSMRFPSEKNKQKGNRDMGGDAELAVKHNTGQLGTGERH